VQESYFTPVQYDAISHSENVASSTLFADYRLKRVKVKGFKCRFSFFLEEYRSFDQSIV
jgi:hypothetical protein